MSGPATPLRFVIALQAEARPLIARYRLQRDASADAWNVFRRDDVALVVCGLGKVAAAAATAYLYALAGGERQAAWLNLGIAGHGRRAVGEAIVAHKVRDRASGRSWYPPLVFKPGVATDEVVTVDDVERDFADGGAHEMEASGFYPTACRFSTAELVHCFKVVSDGPEAAPEKLSARSVERLIEDQIGSIEALSDSLRRLATETRQLEAEPTGLADLLERRRFTVTEERQLRRLVERWQVLAPGEDLPGLRPDACRRGKDVLRALREEIDRRGLAS